MAEGPISDRDLNEIERLLEISGRYHRRIQFTDWQTTTPEHLSDCFSHALRESYNTDPAARFWWVETGEQGSPLIVGYLGNGPSSELNAWLLGAGPALIERLRAAEAAVHGARLAALREALELCERLFAEREINGIYDMSGPAGVGSCCSEIRKLIAAEEAKHG